MLLYSKGNPEASLSAEDLKDGLYSALDKLGSRKKVLAIGPDITRFYSRAGELTYMTWQYYGDRLTDVLPAVGTHFPMTEAEIKKMYGQKPLNIFRKYNWRTDTVTVGCIPADFIKEVREGKL